MSGAPAVPVLKKVAAPSAASGISSGASAGPRRTGGARPATASIAKTNSSSATTPRPAASSSVANRLSQPKKPLSSQASANTTPQLTPRVPNTRERSPAVLQMTAMEPEPQVSSTTTPKRRTPRKKSSTPGRQGDKAETYVPKDDPLDEACRQCAAEGRTSGMLYREIAVAQHDKNALFNLGWMYYFGAGGCEKSEKMAWSYFATAAHQGHAMAQYYCGVMKEHGQGGQARSSDAALALYLSASVDGCDLGTYAAARMNEVLAHGVVSADTTAMYKLAASQGSRQAVVRLQQLGAC